MVRLDSQVKYAAVAAGEAEIYLRPRSRPDYRENVWDHAAGVAVVEHAGGRVTDLDGRVLDFRHGRRLEENRGVLATNGAVHDLMLDVLSELLAT
jgi:3'(2'), 5'-bisphosphate nucleotidase